MDRRDHDFSDISTWGLLRKQRVYAEGGFVVWRRRGTTYEATPGRLAPYVLLPLAVLLGAALLVPPLTRVWGEWILAVGVLGLGLLAVGLTIAGLREDRAFPGLRYNALEIPRRWATLWGAFSGLLTYGWQGRRPPSSAEGRDRPSAKP